MPALFGWRTGGLVRLRAKLIVRNEDLDFQRCKPEFVTAMCDDLRWLGLEWNEGPDAGRPICSVLASQRRRYYVAAWRQLRDAGCIYPCSCSRKDLDAPSRRRMRTRRKNRAKLWDSPAGTSWQFHVPDGEKITFNDLNFGHQEFIARRDFSDFLIWRRDHIPAYQLAVVADDEAMQITEVVRGADLLKSTARQLFLIRALKFSVPGYFHCPLMRDEQNVRLAKRHEALRLPG